VAQLDHEPPPGVSDETHLITACAFYRARNTFCHPRLAVRFSIPFDSGMSSRFGFVNWPC
jgi:hypothetical protein